MSEALMQEATGQKKQKKPLSPKKKKWCKRLIALLAVVGLLGAGLSQCSKKGQGMRNSTAYSVTAAYQDLTVAVSGSGTIEPAKTNRVTALVTGEILEAPFEESDVVEKGQVLYRLDAGDVQNSVEQARLALEQSRISTGDATGFRSEGAGVVQQLHVSVGDSVTAGTLVADIADRSTVTLKVPFLSQDAKTFSVGAVATVNVDGYADTLIGSVTEISGADLVDAGGAFVRYVKVAVANPGGITEQMQGSVSVNGRSCSAMGNFSYAAASQVYAKAGGTVTALYVQEGSRVEANTLIGAMGETSTAASASLSFQQAELNYQTALDRLDDYTITAPITGTVVSKTFEVGDKVDSTTLTAAGGYLAVIYDMSSLEFELAIDELDINKIQVGQSVSITTKAVEDAVFTGTVSKVNINGTTVNGRTTYPVKVQVDGVPEVLLPGMNVSADILIEQVSHALCIPVEAVGRGNVVEVLLPEAFGEDGVTLVDSTKVEERTISVGRSDEEYIEVTEGLNEGEQLLVRNQASSMMDMMMGG